MLEVKELCAGYEKKTVIQNISCSFPAGTITSVIGPNGSGKSTLLKAIVNLCEVYSGNILLEQGNLCTNPALKKYDLRDNPALAAKEIAYLSQNHKAPNLTVQRVVLHGRFAHLQYPRRYTKEDLNICAAVMEEVGIAHLADQFVDSLSGGEQQKVYLAMSLAKQAKICLFDEPNTFLDVRHQFALLEQLKKLRSQGNAVIAVFHDIHIALQLSDQILVMEQGRRKAMGSPEEILQSHVLEECFRVRCVPLQDENGELHYAYRNCTKM